MQPYYSHTGRPSIDPELMIRMLIIGYVFVIRSERQLCLDVQVNLAYRWFCRLGLEDVAPDHSVFSCARHGRFRHERFRQSNIFRQVAAFSTEYVHPEGQRVGLTKLPQCKPQRHIRS